MNYDTIQFERDYLGGISYDKFSQRKYKYTITYSENKSMIGKTFFSETNTPRNKYGFHKDGEITYYIDEKSKKYKSIKWMLKSIK